MVRKDDHFIALLLPNKLKKDFEKKVYNVGFQNLSEAIRFLIRRETYGEDTKFRKDARGGHSYGEEDSG